MTPGHRGWQSRFKASPELLGRLNEAPLAVVHDPRELIVLRDHDGNIIDYADTRRTDRMRPHIQSINEAIMGAAIKLRGRAIRDGDPLQVGNANVGAASSNLYRVFNRGSFERGGRFLMVVGGRISRRRAEPISPSTMP